MNEIVLQINGLCKSFGGVLATDHLDLQIERGSIHAVIGPNGAGKTTLINQLSGLLSSDDGKIYFNRSDITNLSAPARAKMGLARTFQITSVFGEFTALENVSLAVQAHDGHSFKFWHDARGDKFLTEPALEALTIVGLEERQSIKASLMSHGERRQLEIAMALATKPKMLLLDEPMAGMGPEESNRMVSILSQLKGKVTILLIEHDMGAVFSLADKITVLVYGGGIATGTPDQIRANPEVRSAYLGDEDLES
ncbi:MAG: ABC transporter ATP-binding protein [Alphaproteobacteria bacterium]